MKRLLSVGLLCVACLPFQAAEAPAKSRNPQGEKVWKEMLDKYDANKDGKLDREERAKVTAEDKAKMEKAGLLGSMTKKTK